MFAPSRPNRKSFARGALALVAALTLAACQQVSLPGLGGANTGASIDPSQPVPVAMLIPRSGGAGGDLVARGLENAARLAVADLQGARIDLRVYDTGGDPGTAAAAATRAVNEGAKIILGPLYTQTTSAATAVIAGRDINMLSFSNNTAVAGGNVFVLGQTFDNVAQRLTGFARRQGVQSVAVVHADGLAGVAGRTAIVQAASRTGLNIATVQSYPLTQQGITAAGPRIAQAVQASGAQSVFLTANVDSDLPLIATTLPENGVNPATTRYMGLTRWNSLPQALSIRGLQGGWFTLPDQAVQSAFDARYAAAYGSAPHPLAGLGYDAIQAVGSLIAQGRRDALTAAALTQNRGFAGASGAFRLLANRTNERALAVAEIRNNQVVVIDPAPRRFGGAGF
ncbi:penicillin-binding protein activator [Rhodobacteraceae bacterium CCMM004]|nr:penicillin-binding protein activator [Rhodobacteraceae bacterium CCMM004]